MKKIIVLALMLVLLTLGSFAFAEVVKTFRIGELAKPGQSADELSARQNARFEGENKFVFVYFDTFPSMLLALRAEQIDYAFASECVAKYVCDRNPDVAYENGFDDIAFSMAVAESDTELLACLNEAIDKLTKDGTIAGLRQTYIDALAADREPEPAGIPEIDGARMVRVVVTGDLPPLDYMTADGRCAGFNVALLAAIGKEANLNFELVVSDAGARTAMLSSGRADAIFWMRLNTTVNADGVVDWSDDETSAGLIVTEPYFRDSFVRMHLVK